MNEIDPKAMKRALKALDTNAVLCGPCGIRFLDRHGALITDARNGNNKAMAALCKRPREAICEMEIAMKVMREGPTKVARFPGAQRRKRLLAAKAKSDGAS